MQSNGRTADPVDPVDVAAWAASGAMALTGRADGPTLGPPAPLVGALTTFAAELTETSTALGRPVTIDALQLLGERAAIGKLERRGTIACGGATRLLCATDHWLALSLARPDDLSLLPAWLGIEAVGMERAWSAVADVVEKRSAAELIAAGAELGLPMARLGETTDDGRRCWGLPCRAEQLGPATTAAPSLEGLVVVDLSSLWAGPLCGSLLRQAGATVWKVESEDRPDGSRLGPPAFFDLLNAGKRSVTVDLRKPEGRQRLHRILANADIVIEASRPRALAQLGIDALEFLATERPRVWISITGHGRGPHQGNRVGFGDDAAVAGGLVAWEGGQPRFCADAIADPATGLVAALACLRAVAEGGTWLLDLALSRVAAALSGPTSPVPQGLAATAPQTRPSPGAGPALGADTAAVLASIGRF